MQADSKIFKSYIPWIFQKEEERFYKIKGMKYILQVSFYPIVHNIRSGSGKHT